jgi:hypothetical protein
MSKLAGMLQWLGRENFSVFPNLVKREITIASLRENVFQAEEFNRT